MISILMPAHINTLEKRDWLNEAVGSLVRQSFDRWELILINDDSPLPISTEHDGDPRIRRFKTPRQSGPATCRNTAAALAEYEALLPLDADDMLADEDTLGKLFEAWDQDREKVVYGDIQIIEADGTRGKVVGLPQYTFKLSLNLNAILPVTALHSYECHLKAGGWKNELDAGLEDVEYWVSAGKAGFCGERLQGVTLLYRRHDESRSYQLRRVNRREAEMRNRIRDMHQDVFEGRYPMGCCGGGTGYSPAPTLKQAGVSAPTTLDQVNTDEKTWVRYDGGRRGQFGVVGQFTNISYQVRGPGHKFEVHVNDLPKFRRAGRGADFTVGVAPPDDYVAPETTETGAQPYKAPQPVLAQIEQLDSVAQESGRVEPVPAAEEPPPEPTLEPEPPAVNGQAERFDLTPLDLKEDLQIMLTMESWSIERLAQADPVELQAYPGIGPAWSEKIVERAKGLLENV